MSVRVRFAPSPTGYLHVGGARTALFNWLLARRHGGIFVLRIEDTDVERSSWEMVAGIVDGLRWLGLDWDEGPDVGGPHGPYFQSQRLEKYRAHAHALVGEGKAHLDSGAVRFKVPAGQTRFDDLVHGAIAFENEHIEDFVILRSDGHPTYHLSVVVDDIDMEITHVVRGDDHISNTPKQVLLYEAFGKPVPRFAHVPLILGPDKKRLSKRHGATSVMEYHRLGYLPEAMVNFLALLGWSPGGDRELLTREELTSLFAIDGISGGNAVFNSEKLDWFNQQHIARLSSEALLARLEERLRGAELWRDSLAAGEAAWIAGVLDLLKPRVKKLDQLVEELRPFLVDEPEIDGAAAAKYISPDIRPVLARLASELDRVAPYDPSTLEQTLRSTAERAGVKAAALIHATRVAVTGRAVSAGLFDVLALLGRERVRRRLDRMTNYTSVV
ncbi:MAG TPA: glutamate--tRNA ligase [Vicinamibacterales bacterium]|nr:glutamate--tRNA ligase [Vicinamibacterales bacterium]